MRSRRTSFAQRPRVLEDPFLQRLAVLLELVDQPLVPQGQDLHREDGRVLPSVEADGGHGYPRRHLRDAEYGIQIQLAANRHSDHRFRRVGRDRTGKCRGDARNSDEDFRGRVPNQIAQEVRGAMVPTRLVPALYGPAYHAQNTPTTKPPTRSPTPILRLFPLPKYAVKAPVITRKSAKVKSKMVTNVNGSNASNGIDVLLKI